MKKTLSDVEVEALQERLGPFSDRQIVAEVMDILTDDQLELLVERLEG